MKEPSKSTKGSPAKAYHGTKEVGAPYQVKPSSESEFNLHITLERPYFTFIYSSGNPDIIEIHYKAADDISVSINPTDYWNMRPYRFYESNITPAFIQNEMEHLHERLLQAYFLNCETVARI